MYARTVMTTIAAPASQGRNNEVAAYERAAGALETAGVDRFSGAVISGYIIREDQNVFRRSWPLCTVGARFFGSRKAHPSERKARGGVLLPIAIQCMTRA